MSFRYFVSGGFRIPSEIYHVIEDDPLKHEVLKGPSGSRGWILANRALENEPHRITFRPESQNWARMGQLEIWIGWDTNRQPTERELVRKKVTPGHSILLGNDERWQVPVARRYEPGWPCALPRKMRLDEFGEWSISDPIEKFAEYYAAATDWLGFIVSSEKDPADVAADVNEDENSEETKEHITYATLADWCVMALAINYRIGKYEAASLGLLNESTMVEIMNAAIDLPTARDIKKKEEPNT